MAVEFLLNQLQCICILFGGEHAWPSKFFSINCNVSASSSLPIADDVHQVNAERKLARNQSLSSKVRRLVEAATSTSSGNSNSVDQSRASSFGAALVGHSKASAGDLGSLDPCVVPRAIPIVEAMAAMVILDYYLINKTKTI